mmetsp:Transcript_12907/g.40212  ORF Transcript_12907/g.40212 Transcript_12907/m.40212 type:complete len:216 (+) Transcript_12907:1983-2630(+)
MGMSSSSASPLARASRTFEKTTPNVPRTPSAMTAAHHMAGVFELGIGASPSSSSLSAASLAACPAAPSIRSPRSMIRRLRDDARRCAAAAAMADRGGTASAEATWPVSLRTHPSASSASSFVARPRRCAPRRASAIAAAVCSSCTRINPATPTSSSLRKVATKSAMVAALRHCDAPDSCLTTTSLLEHTDGTTPCCSHAAVPARMARYSHSTVVA